MATKPAVDSTLVNNDRRQTQVKIESPSVTAAAKKAGDETTEDSSTDGESSSHSGEATLVENMKPAKPYKIEDAAISPTRSKL